MPPVSSAGPMIFLSYRRDDSAGHVGRLYDALSTRFGSQRIFVDIDHISPGQDFIQVVDDAVARCAVLLVVMGKRWGGTGRVGKRRIDDPGDFVRLEVAGGLKRTGLRIVPVLVGGATMLGPAELPDDIKELSRRNAFELSDTRWKEDVTRLITELDRILGPNPAPASARSISLPKGIKLPQTVALPAGVPRWMRWTGVAVAVVAVGFVARGAVTHRSPPPVVTTAPAPSIPTNLSVPANDVRKLPSNLDGAGHTVRTRVQTSWRGDARLTQIDARLPATASVSDPYQVSYTFRSPADGAGLTLMTGRSQGDTAKRLPAAGGAAATPLPETFVDLPGAVATARDSGMIGDVRTAVLNAAGLAGHPGQAVWKIVPGQSDQYHVFYVDATTGRLVHPVAAPPSASQTAATANPSHPSSPKGPGGLIKKIGGLFKKH
jgi:TIR domain-containing protein